MEITFRRIYYSLLCVTLTIFVFYGSIRLELPHRLINISHSVRMIPSSPQVKSLELESPVKLNDTPDINVTAKREALTNATNTPLPTPTPTSSPPISNLYFMKTHKTGSSTLQNILVRYAWNHELIVGLPRSDILFSSYYRGKKFSSKEIQPVPRGRKVNMIFHHMVFNHAEVRESVYCKCVSGKMNRTTVMLRIHDNQISQISSLLPADAVYVTILRDPATLFRSAFHYFGKDVSAFRKASKDGFDAFINQPSRYFHGKRDGMFWWLAKNGMSFDLGYDNMNESESYITDAIRTMEQIFDLVLITEYFDIGLLLLKEKMNWCIEDVAYAAMNARKQTRKKEQDIDTTTKIYKWNLADTVLYKHFNDTFWDKVKQYGEDRMEKDLLELESIKSNYREHCFEEEMISNSKVSDKSLKMFSPPGIDVAQYQLRNVMKRNETCIGLIRPELQWWKKLSARQKT